MNIYTLETTDGRIVEVEGNSPPTDADFKQIMANLPPVEEQKPKNTIKKAYQEADPFTKSMITSGSMYGSPYNILPKGSAKKDIKNVAAIAPFGIPAGAVAKIATKAIPALAKAPGALRAVGRMGSEMLAFTLAEQAAKAATGEGFDTGDLLGKTAGGVVLGGGLTGIVKGGIGTTKWLNTQRIKHGLTAENILNVAGNKNSTLAIAKGIMASKDFAQKMNGKLTDSRLLMVDRVDNMLKKHFGSDQINISGNLAKAGNNFDKLIETQGKRVVMTKDKLFSYFNKTDAERQFIKEATDEGFFLKALDKDSPNEITLTILNEVKQNLDDMTTKYFKSDRTGRGMAASKIRDNLKELLPSDLQNAYSKVSNAKKADDLYNLGLEVASSGKAIRGRVIETSEDIQSFSQGLKENLAQKIKSGKFDRDVSNDVLQYENLAKTYLGEARGSVLMAEATKNSKTYDVLNKLHGLSDQKLGDISSPYIKAAEEAKGAFFGSGAAYLLPSATLGGTLLSGTVGVLGLKKLAANKGIEEVGMLTKSDRFPSITNLADTLSPAPLIRALAGFNTQERK